MNKTHLNFLSVGVVLICFILLMHTNLTSQINSGINSTSIYQKNLIDSQSLLQNKPLNTWNENENMFIDSTTFTEVSVDLPGIYNGSAFWYDYNDDGYLDFIISGSSDSGSITKIFKNENGNFIDSQIELIPLGHGSSFSWGDYDNDGDFDLAIQGAVNFPMTNCYTKIYKNENGTFIDINAQLLGLAGGTVSWVDIDNDGKLDLFVCGSPDHGYTFYSKIYKNVNFDFVDLDVNLPGVWGSSISFYDYDNDGDQDLLLTGFGHLSTITKLFRNDFDGTTINFTNMSVPFPNVNSGSIAWGDYNNDGFADVVLSGISYGIPITRIYQNNAGINFENINAQLKNVAVSSLAWGDYDNDGDLDLIVSGSEDFEQGLNPTTKVYRNDSGIFTDINAKLQNTWFGSTSWGDYNNDGKLDILITGSTQSRPDRYYTGPYYPVTKIYKNNTLLSNQKPSVPTNLSLVFAQGKPQLKWDPAADNQTPVNAITYNLRIGTTPGGHDILAPNSNNSTGFRRIVKEGNQNYLKHWNIPHLPPGTYYWSVQAVDNGFAGSPFATEKTFTITSTGDIIENTIPFTFELYQNYPNPFNSSTTIKFKINLPATINLKVFNVLGQEISTLINDEFVTDKVKSINFNANNLSSGVYFYRISAKEYNTYEIKKMMLIK